MFFGIKFNSIQQHSVENVLNVVKKTFSKLDKMDDQKNERRKRKHIQVEKIVN